MTTCLGKSCSFGLPIVPFVNCCHFMCLVISVLVLKAGCRIWLYQFQIIAYLFTSLLFLVLLNLQRKHISMAIRILGQYKKISTWLHLLFRIRRINTFHQKLVALSPRSRITLQVRRKIRRKKKTHAKSKKTGSSKLRSKFETLRREIKADIRKQHDLYGNNLVGDVKANHGDFYRYINSQKKDTQGIPPLTMRNGNGVAQSHLEKTEEFNGQFTDMFNKNEHTHVRLLDRSAPFMDDIVVSKDGVTKLLKWLNPSKA